MKSFDVSNFLSPEKDMKKDVGFALKIFIYLSRYTFCRISGLFLISCTGRSPAGCPTSQIRNQSVHLIIKRPDSERFKARMPGVKSSDTGHK